MHFILLGYEYDESDGENEDKIGQLNKRQSVIELSHDHGIKDAETLEFDHTMGVYCNYGKDKTAISFSHITISCNNE